MSEIKEGKGTRDDSTAILCMGSDYMTIGYLFDCASSKLALHSHLFTVFYTACSVAIF